jgi:hypothetical protein
MKRELTAIGLIEEVLKLFQMKHSKKLKTNGREIIKPELVW